MVCTLLSPCNRRASEIAFHVVLTAGYLGWVSNGIGDQTAQSCTTSLEAVKASSNLLQVTARKNITSLTAPSYASTSKGLLNANRSETVWNTTSLLILDGGDRLRRRDGKKGNEDEDEEVDREIYEATNEVESNYGSGESDDTLPAHLRELGLELLGSAEELDAMVANTETQHIEYDGVSAQVRMLLGDWANTTFRGEGQGGYGDYGLGALRELKPEGALHMLDVGANLGIASIAAYKKYPEHLRVIAVEAVPSTYLLLRWNLWLNGIPELCASSPSTDPGVMALNRGVSNSDMDTVQFCYNPPQTMNSFSCDCSQQPGYECKEVMGISTKSLVDLFGDQGITLLKLDCEGCESFVLPALLEISSQAPGRIARIAGELHHPGLELEELACRFDSGLLWEMCPVDDPAGGYDGRQLLCNEDQQPCQALYSSDQHVTPPLAPGHRLLGLLRSKDPVNHLFKPS